MSSTLSWRPSLFTQKTARELLFDGFSDPLLTAGAFFNPVLLYFKLLLLHFLIGLDSMHQVQCSSFYL